MTHPRILCVVPARSGSKRVVGKNSRLLGGKPLIDWTLDSASSSELIDRVVVSSDDQDLLKNSARRGFHTIERPASLASDVASSVDVVLHALEFEQSQGREWDILCLLQPTSPFRAPGRIDEGLSRLVKNNKIPAVVGIAKAIDHPFHCFLEGHGGVLVSAAGDALGRSRRTQELPHAYVLTGSFYGVRTETLRASKSFVPAGVVGLVCGLDEEKIDIDTVEDFLEAEEIAMRRGVRK